MKTTQTPLALLVLAAVAAPASAAPVGTTFADLAHCDVLSGPSLADELGLAPPFPVDCSIAASSMPTNLSACPASDVPGLANVEVRMTNLTGRAFSEVWYVGEQKTGFTNFDGTVNGFEAFRIDSVGLNRPLVFETIPNGIFEPGETWSFVIDDWTNGSGFLPEHFLSIGVPSGGTTSSGSIVALAIPAPGAASLFAATGLLAIRRRR